jgi:hypothetical protein
MLPLRLRTWSLRGFGSPSWWQTLEMKQSEVQEDLKSSRRIVSHKRHTCRLCARSLGIKSLKLRLEMPIARFDTRLQNESKWTLRSTVLLTGYPSKASLVQ